ncbi:MAG: poly-beta-hydroxybutyrate polymerase, partial [Microvirga sp.]
RSVFKIHLLADSDVTFLLTSGGHNAGVVASLDKPGSRFQVLSKMAQDRYLDPDTWVRVAPRAEGSWWPVWTQWLVERSGSPTAPPRLGAPEAGHPALGDAPGTYVLQA